MDLATLERTFSIRANDVFVGTYGGQLRDATRPNIREALKALREQMLGRGQGNHRAHEWRRLLVEGADTAVADARAEAERIRNEARLEAELAAHPNAAVYACGPARMLEEVVRLVPEASGRLHLEYFTAPVVEYEPGGPFSVRLALTGVEVTVEPEQSVLEVLREAGVDVLTDCEEGICGSCETGVLEGEVEHRDFVLTAQERAAAWGAEHPGAAVAPTDRSIPPVMITKVIPNAIRAK